jgi:hypothetical protein
MRKRIHSVRTTQHPSNRCRSPAPLRRVHATWGNAGRIHFLPRRCVNSLSPISPRASSEIGVLRCHRRTPGRVLRSPGTGANTQRTGHGAGRFCARLRSSGRNRGAPRSGRNVRCVKRPRADVLTSARNGSPEDTETERFSLGGPRIEHLRVSFVKESGARSRSRTLSALTRADTHTTTVLRAPAVTGQRGEGTAHRSLRRTRRRVLPVRFRARRPCGHRRHR